MHASLAVLGNVLSVSSPPLHRRKVAALQGQEIGEGKSPAGAVWVCIEEASMAVTP